MLDHVNSRLNLMKEWLESPEQLCVSNTKISINLKTNFERKSEIRLDILYPKIRKDKREDVCLIGKRVTTCQYGLVVSVNN